MPDSFREVTNRSWGSRLGGAIKGIGLGLILLVVGTGLLFWNEGRAVHRAKALEEGASTVIHVQVATVDPSHEGRLVHLDGRAATSETVSDPDFGVHVPAIALERHVEMYQWMEHSRSETKKKLGGGTRTVTTYTYSKEWSSGAEDSSSFHHPEGHTNPPMPVRAASWKAGRVTLGAFELDPAFVSQIHGSDPVPLTAELAQRASERLARPARVVSGSLVAGEDPATPRVGDLRIRWTATPPQDVSVIGRQTGSRIVPHQTPNGVIALLERGHVPADRMFQSAVAANKTTTWILRAVGFLLLFLGLRLLFGLVTVAADVVPVLGTIAGIGTGIVAFLLAGLMWTLMVAVAWLFYRPILGLVLLTAAVVFGVLLYRRFHGSRAGAVPPPPPPPPVPQS